MTPQRTMHPIHPVRQRHTAHAVAVHRPRRPRCQSPDWCDCPACRNRWALAMGRAAGERREPSEVMARALWLLLGVPTIAVVAHRMYEYLTTGGAQL